MTWLLIQAGVIFRITDPLRRVYVMVGFVFVFGDTKAD